MADDDNQEDITIRAIPPKGLPDVQRVRLARTIVDMLRSRGFECDLILPEDGDTTDDRTSAGS
jgi:uncharacterized protein YgfB (UPF0149 family)